MSRPAPRAALPSDWGRPGWLNLPSWAISLALHALMLCLFALTMEPTALVGDPHAEEREVGIYFQSGHDAVDALPGSGGIEDALEQIGTAGAEEASGTTSVAVDEGPPVALTLPEISSPRIGIGAGLPSDGLPRDARDMIRSTGTAPEAGGGGRGSGGGSGGGGGTTFFGQKGKGERFVYVLDASGSMYDYNAIGVAKAELLASLAQLDAEQKFQIIFYSEQFYPMLEPGGRPELFPGTDANRAKASQFVRGIQPLEGTRHREALLEALNYSPDIIFFLTDAGEPRLDASDLDRIRRRNNGRCRIHTIEFGKGAPLDIGSNFLKKLARENGGGYAYRDITQFQKE